MFLDLAFSALYPPTEYFVNDWDLRRLSTHEHVSKLNVTNPCGIRSKELHSITPELLSSLRRRLDWMLSSSTSPLSERARTISTVMVELIAFLPVLDETHARDIVRECVRMLVLNPLEVPCDSDLANLLSNWLMWCNICAILHHGVELLRLSGHVDEAAQLQELDPCDKWRYTVHPTHMLQRFHQAACGILMPMPTWEEVEGAQKQLRKRCKYTKSSAT